MALMIRNKALKIKNIYLLLIVFIIGIYGVHYAIAQEGEDRKIIENTQNQPEHPEALPPHQVYDEPQYKTDIDSVLGTFEQKYDIYGRLEYDRGDWPFGLRVSSEYTYYPLNYHIGDGYYESSVKREKGSLSRGDEVLVYYDVTFDTKGNVIAKESGGAKILKGIIKLIAPLIGGLTKKDKDAMDNWITQRF